MVKISNANKMADVGRRIRRVRYLNEEVVVDRRVFRDRRNPLEFLDREEIRERYRFYPETVRYICGLAQLQRVTRRSNPLPELMTTPVSLHFYATNCHHIATADLHGVSRASVSRAMKEFTDKICGFTGQLIRMREDRNSCQLEFCNVASTWFPNIVGVIDGTHIKIQAPNEHEEDFVNRKGFHSINVQRFNEALYRTRVVIEQTFGEHREAISMPQVRSEGVTS